MHGVGYSGWRDRAGYASMVKSLLCYIGDVNATMIKAKGNSEGKMVDAFSASYFLSLTFHMCMEKKDICCSIGISEKNVSDSW